MKSRLLTSVASIIAMTTASAAVAEDYTRFDIAEDVAGPCSYASIDAKDFCGCRP